ncbi:MAG: PilZ domain-containing protein [Vicinamibacterales bacterium]
MQPTPSPKDVVPLPAWRAERRVNRRLQPHEVPWIRHVQPAAGDTARLVNISSGGVLMETTARLQPGRRGTVVIVDAADRSIEAHGEVIRTELVSVGTSGELIYRTAMRFRSDLDLRSSLPAPGPSVAEPLPLFASRIEGPLEGEWLTPEGARAASVTNLSQTGCCLRTDDALGLDQFALLRIHFAPGRALSVSGTVVAVDEGVGCLLRFEDLSSTAEQTLRSELLTLAAHAPRDLTSLFGTGLVREAPGGDAVVVEWQARGREGSDPAA